ncbi:MAG: calcineurin-like phosphoesterase [Harvfovirus sp.]|uniref:Serine/threonine-protein phosphatase n=1 Tax=Harvfovirus sp. TaxID=2487768 RepID=A0A3G5A3J6_9VIRU|nr:MAG: calcineurin-like phosphoesterase [Harvfovirus sp.]
MESTILLNNFAKNLDKFVTRFNAVAIDLATKKELYNNLLKQSQVGGNTPQLIIISEVIPVLVDKIMIYKKMKADLADLELKLDNLKQTAAMSVPTIELYEFKIQNYSYELSHKFTRGFQSAEDKCGMIMVDPDDPNRANGIDNNLSSCDVIETDLTNDWEKILGTSLHNGFLSNEMQHPEFSLIKDLYYEYKKFKSRSAVTELNNDPDWKHFCTKWGVLLSPTLKEIVARYLRLSTQVTANSYVQNINVDLSEKIIMIGDVHGSLHTFLRMLFRWHRFGILDLKTLKISHGYRIVFLGDVVDRGLFSLEIVGVIFAMLSVNNTDLMNPKIIYNRGNHEEERINLFEGFNEEIKARCADNVGLYNEINAVYKYMPTAVILQVMRGQVCVYRYWLCHGGFDPEFLVANNRLTSHIGGPSSFIELQQETAKKYHQRLIRWSDFVNYSAKEPRWNDPRGMGMEYNKYHVYQFMIINKIDFIIRGHQDNYDNNYLFATDHSTPLGEMPGLGINIGNTYVLNEKTNKELVSYNKNISSEGRMKGPIASLVAKSSEYSVREDNIGKYYCATENNQSEVYPVLTISTNTDNQRYLQADSFALLRFDKPADNFLKPILPLPMTGGYFKKYR